MDDAMKMDSGGVGPTRIKVVGLGGAGGNIVDGLKLDDLGNVHLAAANTDAQSLANSLVTEKLLLGGKVTRGLGAGGDSEIGKAAVDADRGALAALVEGVDLLIIVAGFGGGTGSAAAPVLAEVAARGDTMVLAFVTMPFSFEGKRRREIAEASLGALRQQVHGVVSLPNDVLLQESEEDTAVLNTFSIADQWIARGINSICSMLLKTGLINQDFSSLRSVFRSFGGRTLFGTGGASGEGFVEKALDDLLMCPLLHLGDRPTRLDRILVNVIGGADLGMVKVNQILNVVSRHFDTREDVVLGAIIDEERRQSLEICILGKAGVDDRDAFEAADSQAGDTPAGQVSDFLDAIGGGTPSQAVGANSRSDARAVHKSKLRSRRKANTDQVQFDFTEQQQQRGYFERTDRSLYNDQDLDVPTYMRRGIKIKVKA